jgi:hypothetical protein
MASTYLPFVVGLVLGAIGCLVFIMRSQALSDDDRSDHAAFGGRRQLAMRLALSVDVVIAFIFLVVAVVLGDIGFIVTAGILMVCASAGLAVLWSADGGGDLG